MTWQAQRVYEDPKFDDAGKYVHGPHDDVGVGIWNTDHHHVVYLESTDGTFRCRMKNGRFGMLRMYADAVKAAEKEK